MADPAALPAIMPSANINGWTAARQKRFLEAIAEGSSVTVACAFVSLSTTSAYAFRRRANGRAFDRVWRAADLLARERIAAELTERAQQGQIVETTRPDGSVITRHYHDNRLALQLLARLDRYADASEGTGPGREARDIAADFDTYLDLIGQERAPTRADPFRLADDVEDEADDRPVPAATTATLPSSAIPTPDNHPAPRDHRRPEPRAAAQADAASGQPVTTPDAPTPPADLGSAPRDHRRPEPRAAAQADAASRQPVTTSDAATSPADRDPASHDRRRPKPRAAAQADAASRQPMTTPDTPPPSADRGSAPHDRRHPEPRAAAQADAASRQPVTTPDAAQPPADRTPPDPTGNAPTGDAPTDDAPTDDNRTPAQTDPHGRRPVTTPPARSADPAEDHGDAYDDEEEEYDVFDYRNYLPGARKPEHAARPPVEQDLCRCDHGFAP